MSVYLTLDKSAYPEQMINYEDTSQVNYAYAVRNALVYVHGKKVGQATNFVEAIFNFKHLVLVEGTNMHAYRTQQDEMM